MQGVNSSFNETWQAEEIARSAGAVYVSMAGRSSIYRSAGSMVMRIAAEKVASKEMQRTNICEHERESLCKVVEAAVYYEHGRREE
jgi:hypothetical protein